MFVECEWSSPSGHQTCPWSETEQEVTLPHSHQCLLFPQAGPRLRCYVEIGQHGHWTDRHGKERTVGGWMVLGMFLTPAFLCHKAKGNVNNDPY